MRRVEKSFTFTCLRLLSQTALAVVAVACCLVPAVVGDELVIPSNPLEQEQTATSADSDASDEVLSVVEDSDIPPVSAPIVKVEPSETPMSPQAVQFVRGMALMLLPETYSDDDDWGNQKRIQSGLNVRMDGLRLDTSRRWKEVNHGTWQRVDATLVDPEQHFQLAITLLPKLERGVPRYRVSAKLRLRATGRQQRWNYGVKLYSVSADVVADVSFTADLQFRSDVLQTESGSKLRVLPHLETANARLDGFSLRGVSHAKGGAVREFGKLIDGMLQSAVKRKSEKLPTKVNAKIQKKPERFEVPAGVLAIFGTPPPVEQR